MSNFIKNLRKCIAKGLTPKPGEVDRNMRALKSLLHVWSQPDWALSLRADKSSTALTTNNQVLCGKQTQSSFDRFAGYVISRS